MVTCLFLISSTISLMVASISLLMLTDTERQSTQQQLAAFFEAVPLSQRSNVLETVIPKNQDFQGITVQGRAIVTVSQTEACRQHWCDPDRCHKPEAFPSPTTLRTLLGSTFPSFVAFMNLARVPLNGLLAGLNSIVCAPFGTDGAIFEQRSAFSVSQLHMCAGREPRFVGPKSLP